MKEQINTKGYSIEEALKIPELREAALAMLKNQEAWKKRSFQTKKFRKALEYATLGTLADIQSEHPDWPLKDVLSDIIKGFNPEIPPDMILEMTQLIIQEWEKSRKPEAMSA